MHLLLGDERDLCCRGVRDALEARGYETTIVANPLVEPARFSWRFDSERSRTSLGLGQKLPVSDDEIAGVLVRSSGWIDPAGWEPSDLPYVQAETQSALLAWLWSLGCPVVNRYPASVWYRPEAPLLSWQRTLEQSGLPMLETVVTNTPEEAREFGRRLQALGVDGVVYGPLTSGGRYLVTSEEDWRGLNDLQRFAPVCLSAPHGKPRRACVVGEHVVWDRRPSAGNARLESALRTFAEAAGLAFVVLAIAPATSGPCVVAVETQPRLEEFGPAGRQEIVHRVAELLTRGEA
jgi:hypothetical protein